MFCAKCKVPWHTDMKCEDFQNLNENENDDIKLKKLAVEMKWKRCPNCGYYVEKFRGCNIIICRLVLCCSTQINLLDLFIFQFCCSYSEYGANNIAG